MTFPVREATRVFGNDLRSSALDLFKEMKDRNIAPNIVTFNTLLEGMDREWPRALALLVEIPKPNSFCELKKWHKNYVWAFWDGEVLKWTFQRLSDLQISNKKVTLNRLVLVFWDVFVLKLLFVCVILLNMCFVWIIRQKTKNMQSTWLIKHFETWCLMIILVSSVFYFRHCHPKPWGFMILLDLRIFVQVGWFNDSTTD